MDLEFPVAEPVTARAAPPSRLEASPTLVGRSVSWRQTWAQAVEGRNARLPLLLRGEAGTGKRALSFALFEGEPIEVLDASLVRLDGFAAWGSRLRAVLGCSDTVVVLTHLEELSVQDAHTVCSLLDAINGSSARVVACVTAGARRKVPSRRSSTG